MSALEAGEGCGRVKRACSDKGGGTLRSLHLPAKKARCRGTFEEHKCKSDAATLNLSGQR